MSEHQQLQTAAPNTPNPTLEEQAAAMDAEAAKQEQGQEQQQEQQQEEQPTTPERPEWLQDKYLSEDRSVEDAIQEQAKAYTELQKKLGERQETTEGNTAFQETLTAAREEFFSNEGKLADETYEKLANAGLPREIVDEFIENQQAKSNLYALNLVNEAGGQKQHDDLLNWGADNLTSEEIDLFNADYTSGNLVKAGKAIRDLQARKQVAEGFTGTLLRGETNTAAGVRPYTSQVEITKDFQSEPYRKGDKAFHDKVQQRLAITDMSNLPSRA